MNLLIKQKEYSFNYQYKVYDNNELLYTAYANRTIIPMFRKISLIDTDGNILYTLKQENLFNFIISTIPILDFFCSCPYILYSDGTKYGYFEKATLIRNNERSDLIGCINSDKYSIYIHSNLKYSIFLNNVQEGLILQSHWKQGDGDIYEVLYNSKLGSKNAALICILIDILYSTLDTSRSTISYQNVTVHGEKNKDECYWTPEK